MQKNRVKSYGVLHPFLNSWDYCDDSDCVEEEESNKDPVFYPEPCKGSKPCVCEREIVFRLVIYNTCGNNNDIKVCPPKISASLGSVDDIKDGFVISLADAVKDLVQNCGGHIEKLTVPIYVVNVNNVLTSGNKNEICIE